MIFDKERAAFLALCAGTALTMLSCGTTSVSPEPQAVSIPDRNKNNRSFFSSIDQHALELAQTGSPANLKQAVSIIHQSAESDYSDSEKVFIGICTGIMELAWSSEKITWNIPTIPTQNPYIGAIESAKKGIYDSNTGNSDFFATLLPSLVLVSATSGSGYYSDAETSLRASITEKPDSILAKYLLGVLLLKKNKPQEAITYLNDCYRLSPSTMEIQYSLINANFLTGNYERALTLGEALLLQYPQNVNTLAMCARCSYAMNNLAAAESYVVKVLLLEPENLDFVLLRARILIDKADYIRASSLLDVYSMTDTSGKEYLLLRATLQRDWNKNYTAAGETIGRALSLYPDDKEVLLCAARISSNSNVEVNKMKAQEITNRILEADPDNTEALEINIEELIKQKQWQKAYELNSRLTSKPDPKNSWFYRQVDICLALKKNTEASNLALKLYNAAPSEEEAQQTYIKVLIQTYQNSTALQLINRLLPQANAKMKSFLYYQRSFLYSTDEDILNDLRSSLTSNPRNKDSLYKLYEFYYGKKDYRRAQYYLKQVVSLDPSNSELLQKNSDLDRLLAK